LRSIYQLLDSSTGLSDSCTVDLSCISHLVKLPHDSGTECCGVHVFCAFAKLIYTHKVARLQGRRISALACHCKRLALRQDNVHLLCFQRKA
jgi:hypothetical protein